MRATLLIAAASLLTGPALAETLTVPTDHPTIQAAVSAASPGDTVLVTAGVYLEHVAIDVPGLNLVGRGAVLDAEYQGDGLSITASDVTVRDFTVVNARTGILVDNEHYWFDSEGEEEEEEEDGPFDPGDGPGEGDPDAVGAVTLVGNTVAASRYGILVRAQAPLVSRNTVSGATSRGLAVTTLYEDDLGGHTAVVTHNRVERCASPVSLAVSGELARVLHNEVRLCARGMTVDIADWGGLGPSLVAFNRIQDSANGDGSQNHGGPSLQAVTLAGALVVRSNRIERSASVGMEVNSGLFGEATVVGNRISDSGGGGAQLLGVDVFAGNTISGSAGVGALWETLGDAVSVEIRDNLLRDNGGDGLAIALWTNPMTVTANRIVGNLRNGLRLEGAGEALTVSDNTISDNGHQGVLNDASGIALLDNDVQDNAFGLGPDIAGQGTGSGSVSVYSGNTGLGGPDVLARLTESEG